MFAKARLHRLFAILLAVALWADQTTAVVAGCRHGTAAEARALVDRAVRLVQRDGPRAAFRAFMRPDGGFLDRDLYVFAIGLDGRVLANGAFPGTVGSDAAGARDSQGRPYVAEMIRLALQRGSGWVSYEWIDPCTGEVARKSSYIRRVGDFLVGVGIYGVADT